MSNFKESLYEKKSFIYKIGEEYFAIGANTFVKVTDSPELDNIELLQNALKKENDRFPSPAGRQTLGNDGNNHCGNNTRTRITT